MPRTATPATVPDFIRPGVTVEWPIWTGEYARATIQFVTEFRVSTDGPMYWEATCFWSLAESFARTDGLRVATHQAFGIAAPAPIIAGIPA